MIYFPSLTIKCFIESFLTIFQVERNTFVSFWNTRHKSCANDSLSSSALHWERQFQWQLGKHRRLWQECHTGWWQMTHLYHAFLYLFAAPTAARQTTHQSNDISAWDSASKRRTMNLNTARLTRKTRPCMDNRRLFVTRLDRSYPHGAFLFVINTGNWETTNSAGHSDSPVDCWCVLQSLRSHNAGRTMAYSVAVLSQWATAVTFACCAPVAIQFSVCPPICAVWQNNHSK